MNWDDVHDARVAFRACLEALSFPGRRVSGLPGADTGEDRSHDGAAAVLLALLDPGLGLACEGGGPAAALGAAVCARTGAHPAAAEQADFILAGTGRDLRLAERARRGTALAPDRGATLVYAGAGADRSTVELDGPGVPGRLTASVPLHSEELASLRRANGRPPVGVDLLVIEPDGSLIGLPRAVLER